jgi:hypothetical protein
MANLPLGGLADLSKRIQDYQARTGMSPTQEMVKTWSQPGMAQEAEKLARDAEFANRIRNAKEQTALSAEKLGLEERRMDLQEEQMKEQQANQNIAGGVNSLTGAGKLGLSLYSLMNAPKATPLSAPITSVSGGTNAGNIALSAPASINAAPSLTGLSAVAPYTAGSEAVAETGAMLTPYLAGAPGAVLPEVAGTTAGTVAGATAGAEAGAGLGPWAMLLGGVMGGIFNSIFGEKGWG